MSVVVAKGKVACYLVGLECNSASERFRNNTFACPGFHQRRPCQEDGARFADDG